MENKNSIQRSIKTILSMPIWVKQYLYVILRDDLSKTIDIRPLDQKHASEMIQNFVPTPTVYARRFIKAMEYDRKVPTNLEQDLITFIKCLGTGKKIIDICNEQKWSLRMCANILIECVDKGFVEFIDNKSVSNLAYYIAGRIRLGEYLLRMNKISLAQVDIALQTQKDISATLGVNTKLGELMVNLGYINDIDKNEVLSLIDTSDAILSFDDDMQLLKDKIDKLSKDCEAIRKENTNLQSDLDLNKSAIISKNMLLTELQDELQSLKRPKGFLQNLLNTGFQLKRPLNV